MLNRILEILFGFKLIHHNTGAVNKPDDTTLPFKLNASLRPPEFMGIAFILLYGGSEEIVVRGRSQRSLERFMRRHNLRDHPRLLELKITGPNGILEQVRG